MKSGSISLPSAPLNHVHAEKCVSSRCGHCVNVIIWILLRNHHCICEPPLTKMSLHSIWPYFSSSSHPTIRQSNGHNGKGESSATPGSKHNMMNLRLESLPQTSFVKSVCLAWIIAPSSPSPPCPQWYPWETQEERWQELPLSSAHFQSALAEQGVNCRQGFLWANLFLIIVPCQLALCV